MSESPKNTELRNISEQNPYILKSEIETWDDFTIELEAKFELFFDTYFVEKQNRITLRDKKPAEQIVTDIGKRLGMNYKNSSVELVQSISLKNGYITIVDTHGKNYIYTLDSEGNIHFLGNSADELLGEQREKIQAKKQVFAETLGVIEGLFTANKNEWLGYIDKSDKVDENDASVAEIYRGKNILEIGALAKKQFQDLNIARFAIVGQDSFDTELYPLERQYMNMTLGISDKYEGGAEAFVKDDLEIQYLVTRQVEARPKIESLLAFLSEEHLKIDDNNHQSERVQESYKVYTQELHRAILERFKQELTKNKGDEAQLEILEIQIQDFVKIITGRLGDIDRELTDSVTANKALLLLLTRSNGIVEKVNTDKRLNAISIQDTEVLKGRSPQAIIAEFKILIAKNIPDYSSAAVLEKLGVLHLEDKNTYESLSFEDKGKVSLIARIIPKLKSQKRSGPKGSYIVPSEVGSIEALTGLLYSLQAETSSEIVKEFSTNFDGDLSDWNGFDRKELELYKDSSGKSLLSSTSLDTLDLFHDINGNGWLDISDTTSYVGGEIAKMIPIIVGGVIIGTLAVAVLPVSIGGSIVVQTALIGAGASMTSWVTHPKGYDSMEDALIDLGSDVSLGALTGAAGGKIAQQFGIHGARLMSVDTVKNLRVNIPDIAVLGFGAEMLRTQLVSRALYQEIITKGRSEYGKPVLKNPDIYTKSLLVSQKE